MADSSGNPRLTATHRGDRPQLVDRHVERPLTRGTAKRLFMAGASRPADAFDGQVTAAQQTYAAGRSLSAKKLSEVPGA